MMVETPTMNLRFQRRVKRTPEGRIVETRFFLQQEWEATNFSRPQPGGLVPVKREWRDVATVEE